MRCLCRLPLLLLLASSHGLGGTRLSHAGSAQASAPSLTHRPTFLPTAALLSDPTLIALVNQLAQGTRIESAGIGVSGSLSEIYARFARLAQKLNRQQAYALLRHESPAVRGYLLWHVMTLRPVDPDALYPLLGDAAEVDLQMGCKRSRRSIADLSFEALSAEAAQPAVQGLLLRVAQDRQLPSYRASALIRVAEYRPQEVTALARSWLHESDPALLLGAMHALKITAEEESAPSFCALASHPNPELRGELVCLFAALNHPCAEPALRKLTEDHTDAVRAPAAATYARIRQRDPAVLRRLLRDPLPRIRVGVAEALAQRAHASDLDLLRDYLAVEPNSDVVLRALNEKHTPEVSAFMREHCMLRGRLTPSTQSSFCPR